MEFMANKFNDLIRNTLSDAIDSVSFDYDCIDQCIRNDGERIEEIEHNSRDGFIPFTNGGFICRAMTDLMSCWGSGCYPNSAETEINKTIEDSLDTCVDEFIRENSDKLCALYGIDDVENIKKEDVHYNALHELGAGDLAESLSDSENIYLTEQSEFWLELRAMYFNADNHRNESGEDEILFLAGVNLDYAYGRDCGLQVSFSENWPVSKLTENKVRDIIERAKDSI